MNISALQHRVLRRIGIAVCCVITLSLTPAHAARFGAYNARAMAMGGTGVASASSDAAHYFNPALLAFYPQFKERAPQSRAVIPSASATVTDSVWHLAEFNHTNYETDLQVTIDNYNLDKTRPNASHVGGVASDLQSMLDAVAYDLLTVDATVGIAFGIPSRWQGGTFFLHNRVMGAGVIEPSAEDVQLLNDYINAMNYIATGGAQGQPVPELFDDQGNLIDLSETLTSTASARGLFLVESGVSVADSVDFAQRTWRWGLTPKIQAVSSFDYVEKAVQGGLDVTQDSQYRVQPNADFGVALDLPHQQRVGVVIKNIFPFKLTTPLSRDLTIEPQLRAGWTQHRKQMLLAVDVDLLPNDAIAESKDVQELAIGAEWRPTAWLRPRLGYNHNLRDFSTIGLASAGVGLVYSKMEIDITLGRGEDKRQAALQLAFPF